MFIRLGGRYFNTRLIFCIDKANPSATQTIIFPPGADPAHGGYLVDMPLEKVLDKVQQSEDDEDERLEALAAELEEDIDREPMVEGDESESESESAPKSNHNRTLIDLTPSHPRHRSQNQN